MEGKRSVGQSAQGSHRPVGQQPAACQRGPVAAAKPAALLACFLTCNMGITRRLRLMMKMELHMLARWIKLPRARDNDFAALKGRLERSASALHLWAKSGPLPVLVNKVLLGLSHAYWCMHESDCFHAATAS